MGVRPIPDGYHTITPDISFRRREGNRVLQERPTLLAISDNGHR